MPLSGGLLLRTCMHIYPCFVTRHLHVQHFLSFQVEHLCVLGAIQVHLARAEVLHGEAHNAKADVYAAAFLIYQIFAQLNISSRFLTEGDAKTFAYQAAAGQRPPFPERFGPKLRALIAAGWAAEAVDRPTAPQLLQQVLDMEASPEGAAMLDAPRRSKRGLCCL